jgi:hypothetical protein
MMLSVKKKKQDQKSMQIAKAFFRERKVAKIVNIQKHKYMCNKRLVNRTLVEWLN